MSRQMPPIRPNCGTGKRPIPCKVDAGGYELDNHSVFEVLLQVGRIILAPCIWEFLQTNSSGSRSSATARFFVPKRYHSCQTRNLEFG